MVIPTKKVAEIKGKQPLIRFKAWPLTLSIWENTGKNKEGKELVFHSWTLQRSYKDKDDQWHDTESLKPEDAPKAVMLLNEAYKYTFFKEDEGQTE